MIATGALLDEMVNSPLNRRTALVFLAHPDDAEILCAGTLVHAVNLLKQLKKEIRS